MGLTPNAEVEIALDESGSGHAIVEENAEALQVVVSDHPNAVVSVIAHDAGSAMINVAGGFADETTKVTYYTEGADEDRDTTGEIQGSGGVDPTYDAQDHSGQDDQVSEEAAASKPKDDEDEKDEKPAARKPAAKAKNGKDEKDEKDGGPAKRPRVT